MEEMLVSPEVMLSQERVITESAHTCVAEEQAKKQVSESLAQASLNQHLFGQQEHRQQALHRREALWKDRMAQCRHIRSTLGV